MQHIRRSATPLRNRCGGLLRSWLLEPESLKCLSDFSGLAAFSSYSAAQRAALARPIKGLPELGYARQYNTVANCMTRDKVQANGILGGRHCSREFVVSPRFSFELMDYHGPRTIYPCFGRSFASRASNKDGQGRSETRKDVSTVEDPFDAPTYNIPEKPVTFTEGASYSIIILAGLGVAAAAAYAVFKELIFQPKEYKIFNKALKRIQDDSQVRVRIGTPIKGYGQESRNRAARQRIPNKIYTDEDGVEHVLVNFYIRGPHGAGKVSAEMFQDKNDKQWKYTYLIVEILQPSRSQLILESYMPAPAPVAA